MYIKLSEERAKEIADEIFITQKFNKAEKKKLQALAVSSFRKDKYLNEEDLAQICAEAGLHSQEPCAWALAGVLPEDHIGLLNDLLIQKEVKKSFATTQGSIEATFCRTSTMLTALMKVQRKRYRKTNPSFRDTLIKPFVARLLDIAKEHYRLINSKDWTFELCQLLAPVLVDCYNTLIASQIKQIEKNKIYFPQFAINNAIAIKYYLEQLGPSRLDIQSSFELETSALIMTAGYLILRFLNAEIMDCQTKFSKEIGTALLPFQKRKNNDIKLAFQKLCIEVLQTPFQSMANDLGKDDRAVPHNAASHWNKLWYHVVSQLAQGVTLTNLEPLDKVMNPHDSSELINKELEALLDGKESAEQKKKADPFELDDDTTSEEGYGRLVAETEPYKSDDDSQFSIGYSPDQKDKIVAKLILEELVPQGSDEGAKEIDAPKGGKDKFVSWPNTMKIFFVTLFRHAKRAELELIIPLCGHREELDALEENDFLAARTLFEEPSLADTSADLKDLVSHIEAVDIENVSRIIKKNPRLLFMYNNNKTALVVMEYLFSKLLEIMREISLNSEDESLKLYLTKLYEIFDLMMNAGFQIDSVSFSKMVLTMAVNYLNEERLKYKSNQIKSSKSLGLLVNIYDYLSSCKNSDDIISGLEEDLVKVAKALEVNIRDLQQEDAKVNSLSLRLELINLVLYHIVLSERENTDLQEVIDGIKDTKICANIQAAADLNCEIKLKNQPLDRSSIMIKREIFVDQACNNSISFVIFFLKKKLNQLEKIIIDGLFQVDLDDELLNSEQSPIECLGLETMFKDLAIAADSNEVWSVRVEKIISIYNQCYPIKTKTLKQEGTCDELDELNDGQDLETLDNNCEEEVEGKGKEKMYQEDRGSEQPGPSQGELVLPESNHGDVSQVSDRQNIQQTQVTPKTPGGFSNLFSYFNSTSTTTQAKAPSGETHSTQKRQSLMGLPVMSRLLFWQTLIGENALETTEATILVAPDAGEPKSPDTLGNK